MRIKSLFLLDMRFQAKYGFYLLYAILTAIYIMVLAAVPEGWKETAAAILIFSDPASMGLFFMGAIVLLEKSQRTPCAFAVSPVRPTEYIVAKVGSLSAISLAVAGILALAAGVDHLHMVLLGTLVASVIFTLFGIIVATNIVSLNQFILWTVPIEIACFIPAILHLFKITPTWWGYYPVNACMGMISGYAPSAIGFFNGIVWIGILFVVSKFCVLKMWDTIGGAKL